MYLFSLNDFIVVGIHCWLIYSKYLNKFHSSPVSVVGFSRKKKEDKSMPTFSVSRNYFCCFQVKDLFTEVSSHLTYTVPFNKYNHLFNIHSYSNLDVNQNMTVLTMEISILLSGKLPFRWLKTTSLFPQLLI